MFHVRRRPADCQPRRRKKKSGSLRAGGSGTGVGATAGILIETQADGTPLDNGRSIRIAHEVVEVGSANGVALQLYGPSIQPRHCVLATNDGVVTLTPLHADAHTYVNGQRIYHTTILQHGCIIKFDRTSTYRYMDPVQENKLNRNISQSQNFDTGSVYDRSPTSPVPDASSGLISPMSQNAHNQLDLMQSPIDPSGMNSTGDSDFQRAMSPILSSNKMGSQDNFGFNPKNLETSDTMLAYANNNNNSVKMDNESLMLSQHLANSKADLLQENHFALPYNGMNTTQTPNSNKDQQSNKSANSQYKDNYETTFDLDGNVETKSICSAKSGGSGHDNRLPRGQEAILPAVLEFPEQTQNIFLQHVITKLDVNAPGNKLAPVYTLYLCARYRASTHYRPELTPTERAHKLTILLHHIASLIQSTVQDKYSDAAVQAFWMANSSELLHFLKCDRHISAFTVQAQDILLNTVQTAFSNLVACFHLELSQVLTSFLEEGSNQGDESGVVIAILNTAMVLLRQCRVNAALTIQLFSQLFHYINVWCFNKVVNSSYMWCSGWGASITARLAPVGAWAERQGLEYAADCHLALIHQCANLLQAPKNTMEDITNLTSMSLKLNSVQLRTLLGGFAEDTPNGIVRLQPELVEAAVKHAQGVVDELHRAEGKEITLEESGSLPLSLLIPEDGFSSDVMRGIPGGLTVFLEPLQRSGLCRLTPQLHSQGHWTVYMTGYNGNNAPAKQTQQPVVEVIQLQKNSNGMGLSIVAAKGAGQSKLGIYIKSVVPGGAAAADQRLQAGDQLLAVDGNSLVGITQEKAAEYLVRTGPVVTLHVAKQGAVLHGLATLLRQPSPQTNRDDSQGIYNPYNFQAECIRYSSDDSLNDNYKFIPKVVINLDDGETQTCLYDNYYDRSYPYCERTLHREQSVDSSAQSCDSDCSYPECMEKFDYPARFNMYERKISENSDSSAVYLLDKNYDEIPFIDDIDSEPVIFEYKSCDSNIRQGFDRIRGTVDRVKAEPISKNTLKKKLEYENKFLKHSIKQNLDCLRLNWKRRNIIPAKKVQSEGIDKLIIRDNFVEPDSMKSDSPEKVNVEYGSGKVKALAERFNKINLAYQTKILQRNCQSSPNLSQNDRCPLKASSVSLENVSKDSYSDAEKRKILMQLEDWSIHGTRGDLDIDKLTVESETEHKSPLNKKFGSLEKLTGSLTPKTIELVLRKTQSVSDICDDDVKKKPAIEKTKLVMQRKKFPDSYIVRKKNQSCPNLNKHRSECPSRNSSSMNNLSETRSTCKNLKMFKNRKDIRSRRMSERDLPSKVDMEQTTSSGHIPNTVKSSKSVPALHEHMKQHEVFNPGYSRTSSNNSIPAMPGLKPKNVQGQPQAMQQQPVSDQNSFYQNLSVYRNSNLGDRSSTLRNSQNSLQLHGQTYPKNIHHDQHNTVDRVTGGNQRPQSAYYGNQMLQNSVQSANTIRTAQSTKDLAYNPENQVGYQGRGTYPSMPNVNQGYNTNLHSNNSQSYNQIPANYHGSYNNSMNRPPMSPLSPNQHVASPNQHVAASSNQHIASPMNHSQYPMQNINNQNHFPNQSVPQTMYNNQNHYPNQMPGNQITGSSTNLRGQAKLAEMSEEVTRRQQRGSVNAYDQNMMSPLQQKRTQYQDGFGPNGPISPNVPMSPVKQQPPVAPKPQNIKRDMLPSEMISQDIPEGPPLPPPITHPLYNQVHDDAYLASSSDPPAVSYYPTQRGGQNQLQHLPPNPWEREEREKEMEARRMAGRMWRDQQIASLQGEDHRTPQQEQQLRALTLERDFERRAQEAQADDDDKEEGPKSSQAGLLRLANNMNNPPELNPVNIVQPATTPINSNIEQDNTPSQQENRMIQPPPVSSIQPKSILKSNLRLDNLNSNSPQSPSKSQKNASFSANLTPQTLKFDNVAKYDSKYDYNINNKYETMPSKYDVNSKYEVNPKYDVNSKYGDQNNAATVVGMSKFDPQYSYNVNNNVTTKFETNPTNVLSPNQLVQPMSELYVNSTTSYNRMENTNANTRFEQFNQESYTPAPPPPERGSSFAVMSQQQMIRSSITSNTLTVANTSEKNNTIGMKDKRVSFHDNDHSTNMVASTSSENQETEMEPIREDPDRFIIEAESMLQSPSTPTGTNVTHTPGVIGAQEVYRDPRQRRLDEQQKAQQAGATPIPEKLSFKEKMKMFALESGESHTPKDKVKISRAQRDIDAVH